MVSFSACMRSLTQQQWTSDQTVSSVEGRCVACSIQQVAPFRLSSLPGLLNLTLNLTFIWSLCPPCCLSECQTKSFHSWSDRLFLSKQTSSVQKSKSWHFHFSRYKSLIRRWILVVSSQSVAPKAIWNMYQVEAMWVTEGWTQHQTLEYLCSYDHPNQALGKTDIFSHLCLKNQWSEDPSLHSRRHSVDLPIRVLSRAEAVIH